MTKKLKFVSPTPCLDGFWMGLGAKISENFFSPSQKHGDFFAWATMGYTDSEKTKNYFSITFSPQMLILAVLQPGYKITFGGSFGASVPCPNSQYDVLFSIVFS